MNIWNEQTNDNDFAFYLFETNPGEMGPSASDYGSWSIAEFEKVRYVNEFAKLILKILIRDQDTLDTYEYIIPSPTQIQDL